MHRMWLVVLVTLFAFSSGIARAQVSDDVVKIGVLTDLSGPGSDRDRSGFGGGRADGGRRFRRHRLRQADPGDFRRPSDQAGPCRRHRPAMVRP